MKFYKAMELLQENGKKVRCKDWPDKEKYLIAKGNCIPSSFTIFAVDVDKEWEIYEDKKPTYAFRVIITLAKEGKIKRFRRKDWDEKHYSYFWCDVWKTVRVSHGLEDAATFLLEDIETMDWIIVE